MIKLINLLNEGKQVGILYHYTNNLEAILSSNKLRQNNTNYGDDDEFDDPIDDRSYISFTRYNHLDRNNNIRNIHLNSYSYGIPNEVLDRATALIKIDGNKLSNNYKIQPFKDKRWEEDNETEERIYNTDINNLNKYIIGVKCFNANESNFLKQKFPNINFL